MKKRIIISTITVYFLLLSASFPVLLDETGDVGSAFLVTAIPTNYFVLEDGTIYAVTHNITAKSGTKILEEMLNHGQ